MNCPHGQRAAGYHADRPRTVVRLVGTLHYQRACYSCRVCGKGLAPFDPQAGISARQRTPAVERLATLAGAVAPSFERGADLPQETAGLRRSASTIERTTEDTGGRIAKLLADGTVFGPAVSWDWRAVARGRRLAYFTIDATGTRQQGPHGRQAEGRMAYVAGVSNPAPPDWLLPAGKAPPPLQARYLSGLYPLAARGAWLRRPAAHVGMEAADLWIALTDGGGLAPFAEKNFSRPTWW